MARRGTINILRIIRTRTIMIRRIRITRAREKKSIIRRIIRRSNNHNNTKKK